MSLRELLFGSEEEPGDTARRRDAVAIAMFSQITRAKLAFVAELVQAGELSKPVAEKWIHRIQRQGFDSIQEIRKGALDEHPTGNRSSLAIAGAFGLFRLLELRASEVVANCHAIIHAALSEANMKGLAAAAQSAARATREIDPDEDLPIM